MNNEQLNAALVDLLGYVKATADFASAQAPLVAQELIRWGIVDYLFWTAWWLVCLGALAYAYRVIQKREFDYESDRSLASALLGAVSLGVVFGIFVSVSHVAMAMVAPRVFVLDQIRHMIR